MTSAWNKKKDATVALFTREKNVFLKTSEHFTAQEEQEEEDVKAPEEDVKDTTQEKEEEKRDESVVCTREDSEGYVVCELQKDKDEEEVSATSSSSALEEVPDVSSVQEEPAVSAAPLSRQQRRALEKADRKKEKKRLKGIDVSRDTGPEMSEKTKAFLAKYHKRAEGQGNVPKSSSTAASSSSQFEDVVSKKMMDDLKEVSRELGEATSEHVSAQHRNAGQNVSEKDKEKEMFLQAARSIHSVKNARVNKNEFLDRLKPQVSPAGYSQAEQLMKQYKRELLSPKEVKKILFTLASTD